MAQTEQLSLSWDAHQKSICNGLSLLQQRGEFVDMTLAADGHHVKVHQMVLSLVSPYIKDLISSAQCPHPVIFLNNISYTTLSAILEYIYTGEVLVPKNKLADLIAAGKALHIKGLREMDDRYPVEPESSNTSPLPANLSDKFQIFKEKKKSAHFRDEPKKIIPPKPICKVYLNDDSNQDTSMDIHDDTHEDFLDSDTPEPTPVKRTSDSKHVELTSDAQKNVLYITTVAIVSQKVHYTLSNQGGLQAVHNRFIYSLSYYRKKDQKRHWRCVDHARAVRCRANICTNERNEVTDRLFEHNHPMHDRRILKNYRNGIVFSVLDEAEDKADCKKKEREKRERLSK